MRIKRLYLTLFILGVIIPYWELISFFIDNGADFGLMYEHMFENHISSFFTWDVILSAVVLIAFIYRENTGIKNYWISIIFTLFIGVSAGFPFFLYQRERQKSKLV